MIRGSFRGGGLDPADQGSADRLPHDKLCVIFIWNFVISYLHWHDPNRSFGAYSATEDGREGGG